MQKENKQPNKKADKVALKREISTVREAILDAQERKAQSKARRNKLKQQRDMLFEEVSAIPQFQEAEIKKLRREQYDLQAVQDKEDLQLQNLRKKKKLLTQDLLAQESELEMTQEVQKPVVIAKISQVKNYSIEVNQGLTIIYGHRLKPRYTVANKQVLENIPEDFMDLGTLLPLAEEFTQNLIQCMKMPYELRNQDTYDIAKRITGNFIIHLRENFEGLEAREGARILEYIDKQCTFTMNRQAGLRYLFRPQIDWVLGSNMDNEVDDYFEPININLFYRNFTQKLFDMADRGQYLTEVLGLTMNIDDDERGFILSGQLEDYHVPIDEQQKTIRDIILQNQTPQLTREEAQIAFNATQRKYRMDRTDRLRVCRFIGRTLSRVITFNEQFMRGFCDAIFSLRMETHTDLQRMRNSFETASRANWEYAHQRIATSRLLQTDLANIPDQRGAAAYSTDLRARYPFRVKTDNRELARDMHIIINGFIYDLAKYTQFPEVQKIGVLSPAMLFLLWLLFADCLDLFFNSVFVLSREKPLLQDVIYLISLYQATPTSVLIRSGSKLEFEFTPIPVIAQHPDDPLQDIPRAFTEITMTTFQHFCQEFTEVYAKHANRRRDYSDKLNLRYLKEVAIIQEVPSNIGAYNREINPINPAEPIALNFPDHAKFQNRFYELVKREQMKIKNQVFRESFEKDVRFTRSIDFSVIDISSDVTGQLALQTLQLKVVQRVQEIYKVIGGLSEKYLNQSIEGWNLFIGLEIVSLRKAAFEHVIGDDPDVEVDDWISNNDQRVVRMGSFLVQLTDIRRSNGQYPRYFSQAGLYHKTKRVNNPGDYNLRVNDGNVIFSKGGFKPPMQRGDIGVGDALAAVLQNIKDLDDVDELAAFDDTSGPIAGGSQNLNLIFSHQYINQITIFTLPIYRDTAKTLPIRVNLKHAPIVYNSVDFNLLNQYTSEQILFAEVTNKLKIPAEDFMELTCVQKAMFAILSRLQPEADVFVQVGMFKLSKEFQGTLSNALEKIQETFSEKLSGSICLFFIEGCYLTFYHQNRFTPDIQQFLNQEEYKFHPVLCVVSQTIEPGQGHCFVTHLYSVQDFIKAFGNYTFRTQKNSKMNQHPGFVLQGQSSVSWQNKNDENFSIEQLKKQLLKCVWTLDIETLSKRYEDMKPYCIVIHDGEGEPFSVIEDPDTIMFGFQTFLYSLKQQRSTKEGRKTTLNIYAHNGSQFDWVILIRPILRVFPDAQIYGSANNIKAIHIKSVNIKLLDFCLMVPGQLQNIAKSFKVQHQQFQCKEIQDLGSFNDLSVELVQKIHKYCVRDTQCLWDCVRAFMLEVLDILKPDKYISIDEVLPITNSALAQKVFSTQFQQCGDFQGTLDMKIDQIESDAYYGGMTQAFTFKPVQDCFYIDVNSLYPFAMTQINVSTEPATQRNIEYFIYNSQDEGATRLNDNYLYRVDYFEFKEGCPGLLPVRCPDGSLCYPQIDGARDQWSSDNHCTWRTGWELNACLEGGLLQELILGAYLQYPEVNNGMYPFQDYVLNIYSEKQKASVNNDPVKKTLYKLLLNQLYGQFAQRAFSQNMILPLVNVLNDPALPHKLAREQLNAAVLCDIMDPQAAKLGLKQLWSGQKDVHTQDERLKYVPVVKAVNRVDRQGQFVEVVMQKSLLDTQRIGMLKRISVMTTGCARAHMIRQFATLYKYLGRDMMYHVHYMDTDSLFVSQQAFKILDEKRAMIHNQDLGKFQKEIKYPLKELRVFGNKVYYAIPDSNTEEPLYKFKGIEYKYIHKQLKTHEQRIALFKSIFDPKTILQVQNTVWKRRFGCVIIEDSTKESMSKPRRQVLEHGWSDSFERVKDYLKQAQNERLVQTEDGRFIYIPIEQ